MYFLEFKIKVLGFCLGIALAFTCHRMFLFLFLPFWGCLEFLFVVIYRSILVYFGLGVAVGRFNLFGKFQNCVSSTQVNLGSGVMGD